MDNQELAKFLDHSVLHPTAGLSELLKGITTASRYDVASFCVKPYHVKKAFSRLKDCHIPISTVIGFPHGGTYTSIKAQEIKMAFNDGAREFDIVINSGYVASQNWSEISKEVYDLTSLAHDLGSIVKWIFETDYIVSKDVIKRLCEICSEANADYVKTSTGFGFTKNAEGRYLTKGATVENVLLMKKYTSDMTKVKASGGIKSKEDALKLIKAGASRLGTSSTEKILNPG